MKKQSLICALALMMASAGIPYVFAKKTLGHDDFDAWKSVRNMPLSDSGEWASFIVQPQEGDGTLTFRNTKSGKEINIQRGHSPRFTADSRWGIALIKPLFKDSRQAKIDKKKDFDAPQDSLAIIDLKTGRVEKIANVISYKIGKKGGDWLTYLSCDTSYIKPKALKDKEAGKPLVIRHLPSGKQKTLRWVKDYAMANDGMRIGVNLKHHKRDSTATDGVGIVMLPDTAFTLIDRDQKFYGTPVFSEKADMMAFTASNDTVKSGTKRARLYLVRLDREIFQAEQIAVDAGEEKGPNLALPHSSNPELQASLTEKRNQILKDRESLSLLLNQYSVPAFSHNGRRLIIGVGPVVAPDDTTLYDFETANLDIWRWDAPMTPPQENKNIEKLRKLSLPVVIDLTDNDFNQQLLTRSGLDEIEAPDRWDGEWALVKDPSKEYISRQWDYTAPEDMFIVNVNTGERRKVGTSPSEMSELSPADKFVAWFDDRKYYAYEIATGETRCVSQGIDFPLWNEDQDIPMMRLPYGIAGWTEDDKEMLVYDRHDIWSLDPTGKRKPYCLTAGEGRKTDRRFKYIKTDDEQRFIKPGQEMTLDVFDYADKRNGLATMKYTGKATAPSVKVIDKYKYTQFCKAKDSNVFSWQRANFNTSPDLWICTSTDFAKAKQVTDINPQMKDYSWGTAELVKWYAYNGKLTEGVLYTPEDFDPDKKYPMLVVFYETNSEELYRHYTMEPSWSWVNYPFYVSRGYMVFVPDVHYAPGIPGESAYNYICSGVEELCKERPWIDKERIGIDGQSWGGYQTAFLVTRTNMFACAGSGAPVANMTSAFGGIRWESGDSRQAQYEVGQSRIGRNLWEAPQLYIANSPVFYADRCNTPLLIMHNDNDGAVPWYQGIEMFMALRRLQKPVWMLQYNGEAHNIRERKNRKDITIRLQQFFDHYLKGDPMPEWMKNGIPAVRKGQEFRTGLTKE